MPAIPMVYVVEYEDGIRVYADRWDAVADQSEDWRKDYARHSGDWMNVRRDPDEVEAQDVAPSPDDAVWSAKALKVWKGEG